MMARVVADYLPSGPNARLARLKARYFSRPKSLLPISTDPRTYPRYRGISTGVVVECG